MSETKHTHDTWVAYEQTDSGFRFTPEGKLEATRLFAVRSKVTGIRIVNDLLEKEATVIAASRELLDACKAALADTGEDTYGVLSQETVLMLIHAITKAEGKETSHARA